MDYGDLLSRSWEKFKPALAQWLIFTLVAGAISMTIVLIPTVARGYAKATLDFIRTGKEPEMSLLWSFDGYVQTLLLLVVLGVAIGLGSLIIVPAIIFGVWWLYSIFYMVDKDMGWSEAMSASKEAVGRTGFMDHLIAYIIFAAINGVGGSVCGLGVLLTAPFCMIFIALIYLDLEGKAGASE